MISYSVFHVCNTLSLRRYHKYYVLKNTLRLFSVVQADGARNVADSATLPGLPARDDDGGHEKAETPDVKVSW